MVPAILCFQYCRPTRMLFHQTVQQMVAMVTCTSVSRYPGLFVYCCDFAASAVQIVKVRADLCIVLTHGSVQRLRILSFSQGHPLCDPARCLPFQCDITSDDPLPFPPASIDLVILIFVLSAIQPSKCVCMCMCVCVCVCHCLQCSPHCRMQGAVDRLAGCLKPGGSILFRDYGRYDMAQLRFKKGAHI